MNDSWQATRGIGVRSRTRAQEIGREVSMPMTSRRALVVLFNSTEQSVRTHADSHGCVGCAVLTPLHDEWL